MICPEVLGDRVEVGGRLEVLCPQMPVRIEKVPLPPLCQAAHCQEVTPRGCSKAHRSGNGWDPEVGPVGELE